MVKINYDKKVYLDIKNTLISDYNVTYDIFKHASLMDVDIVKLFYDNFANHKDKEIIVSQLLGIYGNYFATHEFIMKGYKVINEYELIIDEREKTKVDIAFEDNGKMVLCEVKMALQIILNKDNYIKPSNKIGKKEIDLEKRKYYEIANKLIKQVTKLKKASKYVNVIIFENCFMDDDVKYALSEIGVTDENIIIIPINVIDLHNLILKMVNEISKIYENRCLK